MGHEPSDPHPEQGEGPRAPPSHQQHPRAPSLADRSRDHAVDLPRAIANQSGTYGGTHIPAGDLQGTLGTPGSSLWQFQPSLSGWGN